MELYTKDRNHTVISLPFYLFLSKDFNTNHEEARKKGPLIAQIAAPIATIYRIKEWAERWQIIAKSKIGQSSELVIVLVLQIYPDVW